MGIDINDAISVRYNNKVYEMRAQGENPIVLSLGEAYFKFPRAELLLSSTTAHYTHSKGTLDLRRQISNFYSTSYGVKARPEENVLVSAGSKLLVYMSILAIMRASERKEVLIPQPAWVSYSEQIKLIGGSIKYLPPEMPIRRYKDFVTTDTKIIILCNPNNPSGLNLRSDDVHGLVQLARNMDLVIVSDEAYSEFISDEEEFISIAQHDPQFSNSLIINSISKSFGLSGWRIGYVLGSPQLIDALYVLNQHLMTCAPSALEKFCADNFDELAKNARPQIQRLMHKRLEVERELQTIGLEYLSGTATFYFFIRLRGWSKGSVFFCDELLEKFKIAVVPGLGYGPDCDEYIRISIGSEPIDRIILGLQKIKELLCGSVSN